MATNLADPTREPTDEELVELSRQAFAGVRASREHALGELRERIRSERARLRAELAERQRTSR